MGDNIKQMDIYRASLVAQTVKNLPTVPETWVQSLGWKDPLEKGAATHSSILAWRIRMDRGAWRASAHGVAQSRTRLKQLSTHAWDQFLHILSIIILFTSVSP